MVRKPMLGGRANMSSSENSLTAIDAFGQIADSIVQEMSSLRSQATEKSVLSGADTVGLFNKQIEVLERYLVCAMVARAQEATLQQLHSTPRH
jgi:hypothetical protein